VSYEPPSTAHVVNAQDSTGAPILGACLYWGREWGANPPLVRQRLPAAAGANVPQLSLFAFGLRRLRREISAVRELDKLVEIYDLSEKLTNLPDPATSITWAREIKRSVLCRGRDSSSRTGARS
jgi:hypothetical protein